MIVASIDWTIVLASLFPTIPAILAVLLGASNRRSLRTPSGDTIGRVAERTHDLAAIATMHRTREVQEGEGFAKTAARVNRQPDSPVKVNGLIEQPQSQPQPE